MTHATFDDIIAEVKKVNQRLESIERTLSALMAMLMPEEELSEEEWSELDLIEAEMRGGQAVSLEELEKSLARAAVRWPSMKYAPWVSVSVFSSSYFRYS